MSSRLIDGAARARVLLARSGLEILL